MATHAGDPPEELLDVFRQAALSVTKLYKTSTAAQAKARADGYQDCLDDLHVLLDRDDVDLRTVQQWVRDRLEGRESVASEEPGETTGGEATEASEEDEDKTPEPEKRRQAPHSQTSQASQPSRPSQHSQHSQPPSQQPQVQPSQPQHHHHPHKPQTQPQPQPPSSQDFTFRSSMAYPPESYMELEHLDLSDPTSPPDAERKEDHEPSSTSTNSAPSSSPYRSIRIRHGARPPRAGRLGVGRNATAGQKRKLNVEEIFGLASLGKDVFGRGGSKRSRQA